MTAPTLAWTRRGALAVLALGLAGCHAVPAPTPPPVAEPVPPPLGIAPAPVAPPPPVLAAAEQVMVTELLKGISTAPSPTPPPVAVPAVIPPTMVAPRVVNLNLDDPNDAVFGLGRMLQIEISLTAPEWNILQTSSANRNSGGGQGGSDYADPSGRLIHVGSGFGGYFPWTHADAKFPGEAFQNVGLRYRGNYSFTSSSAAVPLRANFKLKLDTFGTKGSWHGVKTFNFNAGVLDTSLTREALAFALFRAAGVPAPRTAYAELRFNVPGLYHNVSGGRYVMIENVNKSFLRDALPPGDGLLMKPEGTSGGIQSRGATWTTYKSVFRPEREATPHEQQRVIEFAQLISQTDVALFRGKIGTYLDVDEFLRFVALNAFIENWDSYIGGSHNYYFYLDPSDDKFRFIPWDEDLAMGTRSMGRGGFTMAVPYSNNAPLIYWLLDDPAVQSRYRSILKELAEGPLSRAAIGQLCETVDATLGTKGVSPRYYLESRADLLKQQVAAWFPPEPPAAR
jgi:spore coat protein H